MSDRNILVGLILLQLLLGCIAMVGFPISLDEPFSIFHAQWPLDEMIVEINKGNNSPLHFVALHFWVKWFGIEPYAVRSLSLLVSLITVAVLYKYGRSLWRKEYVILLVGLFIFSRLNHFVAVEARMYGFFTLFFTLIIADFYRLVILKKQRYIQLAIWNVLLLYTHYLGGVIILMESLLFIAFFRFWTKSLFWQVGVSALISLVLFIPGIQVFMGRARNFKESGTWVTSTTYTDLWSIFIKLMNNQFTLLVVALFIIGLVIFVKKRSSVLNPAIGIYVVAWFVGTYFLMFLISCTVQPLFNVKYLQFLTIPLALLMVFLLQRFELKKNWNWAKLIILLPFILSFRLIPDVNRAVDKMVDNVKLLQKEEPNTVIYYSPPHYVLTLAYHYDREIFKAYKTTTSTLEKEGFSPLYHADGIHENLAYKQVVYLDLDARILYPDNGIKPKLSRVYEFVNDTIYPGDFTFTTYRSR